jgi:hypothetical protein
VSADRRRRWTSPASRGSGLGPPALPVLPVLTLLAVLAVLVAGAPPTQASESPEVEMRLTGLTGVLGPDQDRENDDESAPLASEQSDPGRDLRLRLLVDNRGEQAVEGLRVVVEIHPAAQSREELAAAYAGDGLGSQAGRVHDQEVRELSALEPGEVAGVEEVIPLDEAAWPDAGGVHPVRVSLVRGAEVLDELVTAVVWLGDTRGGSLLTTFVWPLSDAPWRTEQGRYSAAAQRDIRPGGRLDVLLRALEQHEDAGVLLAPAAHLLEDLRDQASGFEQVELQEDGSRLTEDVEPDHEEARRANATIQRIRRVAEQLPHQPVYGPYADADLDALSAHGRAMREMAGELATEGRRRLQLGLERTADASAFVLGSPIRPEALDLMPTEHLLLPSRLVVDDGVTGRLRTLRSPSGRPLLASVGDPVLEELLASPETDGLAAAQRVLAETAMLYFEDPGTEGRSLSLHPPPDWDPDPEMLHALLGGLDQAPWLELVAPSQQASFGERSPVEMELAEPEDERLSPELIDRLETARTDLAAATSARPTDHEEDEESDGPPERSYQELEDALFRSTSAWLSGNATAESLVRDVQSEIERSFGDVEVASGSQVTLTSDTGQIPVTVRRTRGGPITVRVEIASQGRLEWEERRSDDIVLADEEAHTVSFETRALGTGTFPVTVVVTDPSGTRELERTTLSVRSTAVSGPALSATGVLVLGLLLVGALRRRPRGPRLQVIDGAPGP